MSPRYDRGETLYVMEKKEYMCVYNRKEREKI